MAVDERGHNMSRVALFHGVEDLMTKAQPVAQYATPVLLGAITFAPNVPLWVRLACGGLVILHAQRIVTGFGGQ